MSGEFELHAESREKLGKSASRKLRSQMEKLPAVVYGAGKPNKHIIMDHKLFQRKLENEAFYSHILNLHVDGESVKVVLKALQRHPFKKQIMHADFQRISDKEKIHMQVPLHFINEDKAVGVKKGGILSHLLTSVEVVCLPSDLPEFIEVDVGQLDLDEAIHLSNMNLPKGVQLAELVHHNDLPVVNIHKPRTSSDETEAASGESASE